MIEAFYRMTCDHCAAPLNEEYAATFVTELHARAAALEAGWQYILMSEPYGFSWYCPECWQSWEAQRQGYMT